MTQRQLMSTSESAKCPSNSTFPNITANATVAFPLPITYRCYNKTTHCCVNGYFLCPSNASSLCGVQCYNPVSHTASAQLISSVAHCTTHTAFFCLFSIARRTIRVTRRTRCALKRRHSRSHPITTSSTSCVLYAASSQLMTVVPILSCCQCGESCFNSEQFTCESGQLVGVNATQGNASYSDEMRFTQLDVFSLPIQPAARRLSVLRRRVE